jgi:hypothetical protein
MAKIENHVDVVVLTTSGTYPEQGFDRTPSHQKVKVILKQAATKLRIVSTENWIAKVGGVEINPELSFEENHLTGQVTIDYGPREGGGGA